MTADANSMLANFFDEIEPIRNKNYDNLDTLPAQFSGVADSINTGLDGIDDGIKNYLTEHHDNYDEIIPHYLPAAYASNKVIHYVERGKVTDDWQENIIQTIAQLADTRWKNIESALNDMKIAYDGILGNYLNGAGQE